MACIILTFFFPINWFTSCEYRPYCNHFKFKIIWNTIIDPLLEHPAVSWARVQVQRFCFLLMLNNMIRSQQGGFSLIKEHYYKIKWWRVNCFCPCDTVFADPCSSEHLKQQFLYLQFIIHFTMVAPSGRIWCPMLMYQGKFYWVKRK